MLELTKWTRKASKKDEVAEATGESELLKLARFGLKALERVRARVRNPAREEEVLELIVIATERLNGPLDEIATTRILDHLHDRAEPPSRRALELEGLASTALSGLASVKDVLDRGGSRKDAWWQAVDSSARIAAGLRRFEERLVDDELAKDEAARRWAAEPRANERSADSNTG